MTSAGLEGVQDNGGVSGQFGFSSEASVTTANGTVTAMLISYGSVADAASAFSLFVPSSDTPPVTLHGLGDQATSVGSTVVVRKGAQVLNASIRMSKAAEDQLDLAKENGATFAAVSKSLTEKSNRALLAATKTIAVKLSGATGSTDLTYLPAGALDPCGVDPTKLESGDIKVTSAPMFSDTLPMSACVYTFAGAKSGEPGTGQLTLYTLTTAQGAAAIPPVTPAREYASTLTSYNSEATGGGGGGGGAGGVGSVTDGPFSSAAVKNSETDFALLAQLPESDGGNIIIRISSFRSSYVVEAHYCFQEIVRMYNEELAKVNAGPVGDVTKARIADWCQAEQDSAKEAAAPMVSQCVGCSMALTSSRRLRTPTLSNTAFR